MALFSYPVCTWLCQYVNMGVRKWLEKSAEKQKYKMRKTANPLSRKAFRAVSFSATKDKKCCFLMKTALFLFFWCKNIIKNELHLRQGSVPLLLLHDTAAPSNTRGGSQLVENLCLDESA